MTRELPKNYEPGEAQTRITRRWLETDAFAAIPDDRGPDDRYVIMMPLPNVTGALHMGHAMDNVMQDLLIRWNRMKGKNALWQPGTDHAGIATQAVVEKRLFELEGKTRHDIGREKLVERIWAWKDEYQARIVRQQQAMGCSADWKRQRFTMDAVCSAAVRRTFFQLFEDGLIYRGNRLVNWDCSLQTAVSDDEVYHETVQGHFWHLRYPVIDPKPGEPDSVTVATTRPETMLGDTAVAVHPDPEGALRALIQEEKEAGNDTEALEARIESHLPTLLRLRDMAKDGRRVQLPLMERPIPLILDAWAKPELGSGCVKITPAHDPNDYEVWERHQDEIGLVNLLNPDGTYNQSAGRFAGLDRFEARKQVLAGLEAEGLLVETEKREVEIGHSDRSKTPVEPYLSQQWFVRTADVEGGVLCGAGTKNEFRAAGLAQAALDAVDGDWTTKTGRRLAFHPSRYAGQYLSWLGEKRDWCVSRQLWWGHRIPVWTLDVETRAEADALRAKLPQDGENVAVRVTGEGKFQVQVCLRGSQADDTYREAVEATGLVQDPDVLDTWFSSACWPFGTQGWPDPAGAPIEDGQRTLGATDGGLDSFEFYYPGSCLVTARDIITLWVARMLMFGLYNHGDVPFTDCFVHAKILDGKGVTMSKSRGNGIDPVDIIGRYGADAMRYVICDLETGMQDVRLPVQATCPSCEKTVELAEAKHGQTIFTYLCTHCRKEFDVLGTMEDIPSANVTSDRFEAGRNFCNKLWNAARFAMMNLEGGAEHKRLSRDELAPEDRWILSRLSKGIRRVTEALEAYQPSAALTAARELFWGELCDWYLELIKPRMRDEAQAEVARQVLAAVLDQMLRLLHPFVPFITEALWEGLGDMAPVRGVEETLPASALCLHARWPEADEAFEDEALEHAFKGLRGTIRSVRDLRTRYAVPPKKELPVVIRASAARLDEIRPYARLLTDLARVSELTMAPDAEAPPRAATAVFEEMEIYLGEVLDPEKEQARLLKQQQKLEGAIRGGEAKLGNEKFLAKAPKEVVERERARIQDLRGQLELLKKNLRSLAG